MDSALQHVVKLKGYYEAKALDGSEYKPTALDSTDPFDAFKGAENTLLNGLHESSGSGPILSNDVLDPKQSSTCHSNRGLKNAFKVINNMADRMQLSKTIVEKTCSLFVQVRDARSLKGRRNAAVAVACLYVTCRKENTPRTMKEICAVSMINKKEVGRCFKFVLKALETSVDVETTTAYMPRFCSTLDLPASVQRIASHIARRAVELDIVLGRFPISIAAAAIYMACEASDKKFKKSLKEIEDMVGVNELTIRQSYNMMYPRAIELFPEDFKFITPIELLSQV